MSHKATNWAVGQRGISSAAKVLLWQLADRHNPDNGCFPNQATLAQDCEMSRATVNRNLLELERVGLIVRIQRVHPVTKKQLPTRYVLAFEDDFAEVRASQDQNPEVETDPESRVSNCDTAPDDVEGAAQVQNPDMEDGASRVSFVNDDSESRVSNIDGAVSH